jgi:hypothetical protein
MNLAPFESWADVLAYARTGAPLYYQAPMDRQPTGLRPGRNSPYSYEARGRTIRIWPPGSAGRGRQRTSDPFTADAGHLSRFSHQIEHEVPRQEFREAAQGQPDWEEVGYIGDKNWAEHSGGPVLVERSTGEAVLEYVEPPSDDQEFGDPKARWTVYRVALYPEVPSWGDLEAVADSAGANPEELRAEFVSSDPMTRARAYETWAGHYGWYEFDQYPLSFTCAEMNERYDADLDCGGEDENADLEESPAGRYRVNYGNGQVSNSFGTIRDAQRHLDSLDRYREYAFIEFWDGDDWFTYRPKRKAGGAEELRPRYRSTAKRRR